MVDAAAFDALRLDLNAAGFHPVGGDIGLWEGPIFDCFKPLSPGKERMRIKIRDGFPYALPKVFVEGLSGEHVTSSGDVCLWAGTDQSYTWLRLGQIKARAEEWSRRQAERGFGPEDAALDANRYFVAGDRGIAVINLGELDDDPQNDTDRLRGEWDDGRRVLTVEQGHGGPVEGRSYFIPSAPWEPPRTLDDFRAALTAGQRNNLERRLKAARQGAEILVVLFWDTDFGRNALALLVQGNNDELEARAIEVAPSDHRYRLLRAGPDSSALMEKRAVVFGVGAIGSHAALALGACGFGTLVLVDSGRLRPADATRHAAGGFALGSTKVVAVHVLLTQKAPWSSIEPIDDAPEDPEHLRKLIHGADIVVEATGYGRFTDLLSIICNESRSPLVSAALYRAGAIARVKTQAPGFTPIVERLDEEVYPVIPPDPTAEPAWEPGCGEPVNNASPARVLRAAGHLADTVIDVVTGREVPADAVEVYAPIDVTPFDRRGRLEFPR